MSDQVDNAVRQTILEAHQGPGGAQTGLDTTSAPTPALTGKRKAVEVNR